MEGVVRATLCSFQSALASTWDFVVNRKLEPRLTGCQHQLYSQQLLGHVLFGARRHNMKTIQADVLTCSGFSRKLILLEGE